MMQKTTAKKKQNKISLLNSRLRWTMFNIPDSGLSVVCNFVFTSLLQEEGFAITTVLDEEDFVHRTV